MNDNKDFIEESKVDEGSVDIGSELRLASRKKSCVPEQLKKPSPKTKTSRNVIIIDAQSLPN